MPTEGWASVGKFFLLLGGLFIALGALILVLERFPQLPIGRLPGDIRIERGNFHLYIPLGTSLLVSVLLTLLWSLISHLRR
ncbi:MAG TPA: DUF2905 domain-containing protein [Blastocatellia bacterium]|nr:DUF2905 domain-containing protein [Blastocatellia bacterium]